MATDFKSNSFAMVWPQRKYSSSRVCMVVWFIFLLTFLILVLYKPVYYMPGLLPLKSECDIPENDVMDCDVKDDVNARGTAVVSLATHRRMTMFYAFCVPLAAAAWKRLGFKLTVLIVGDIKFWNTSKALQLVAQTTRDIAPDTEFLLIPVDKNPVSYAQVIRLFSAILMPCLREKYLILTSDVDLLPLNSKLYDLIKPEVITILNADCCKNFRWHNQVIPMQPIAVIAMNSETWKAVMNIENVNKNTSMPEYINQWLQTNYDGRRISDAYVIKGENDDWSMDQRLISIQIHNSNVTKLKIFRDTAYDRVDRVDWSTWRRFASKTDAHMFLPAYNGSQWNKTKRLIVAIFDSMIVQKLISYRSQYVKLLKFSKTKTNTQ